MPNDYEVLLMLDPEMTEARQEEIIVRARELIEKGGGTWVGHDPWGRRKLAFPVDKKTDGDLPPGAVRRRARGAGRADADPEDH